jgi:hypothetical protein
MSTQDELLNPNDYVFNNKDGKITSFGYAINSDLLKRTLVGGGSTMDPNIFEDLAVPAGFTNIVKSQSAGGSHIVEISDGTVINDDIYDRLLDMVTISEDTKKRTKRLDQGILPRRKTRKNSSSKHYSKSYN